MLIDKIRKEIEPYGGTIEKDSELDQYRITFPLSRLTKIKVTREAFQEEGYAVTAIRNEDDKLRFDVSVKRENGKKIELITKYGKFEKRLVGEQVLFAIYGVDEDDHAAAVIGDGQLEDMYALLSGALMAVERAVGLEETAAMVGHIMSQRLEGIDSVQILSELRGSVNPIKKDVDENEDND